jgi:hypothetical protein
MAEAILGQLADTRKADRSTDCSIVVGCSP